MKKNIFRLIFILIIATVIIGYFTDIILGSEGQEFNSKEDNIHVRIPLTQKLLDRIFQSDRGFCVSICDEYFDPSVRGSCFPTKEQLLEVLPDHIWTDKLEYDSCAIPTSIPTPTLTPLPIFRSTPTPTPSACNQNDWGEWTPVCTALNCASATQTRTNACGTKEQKVCTCVINYPTLSPSPSPGVSPAQTKGSPNSWFKTKFGDVHSNKDIIVSLPSLTEKFATFLVTANALSTFASGTDYDARPDLASEKNWYWYSPPYGQINYPELSGFYDYYLHLKPPSLSLSFNSLNNATLSSLAGSGTIPIIVVHPSAGQLLISEDLSLSGNRQLILYIDGDLVINNNIFIQGDAGIIFVVKGDVKISANPIEVDGFYLVDKIFNTTSQDVNIPLQIKGAVYVSKNGKIFGQSRKVNSVTIPSEYFIFEPKYLVKFSAIFGRTSLMWRETAP